MMFGFFQRLDQVQPGPDCYLARIRAGIKEKGDLLDAHDLAFRFPYFGRNWDALDELLGSLEWINEHKVIIIHEDVPLRDDLENAQIYIDILRGSAASWKMRSKHTLEVLFPETERNLVLDLSKEKTQRA